jgi:hypothetical protein
MTKPISHHLTTGTFNYVVKDPNCNPPERAALDQGPIRTSRICVLELGALYQSSVGLLLAPVQIRGTTLDQFPFPG